MRQGGRGEVDRGDLPSARGKPERVGPVTAAGVERRSGAQVPYLRAQMCVRGAMLQLVGVLA